MGWHAEGDSVSVDLTRDAAAIITSVGETMVEVLGWRADQLVGRPSTDFVHPEDQPSAIAAWFAMIASAGETRVWRGRYRDAAGTWRWVETVNVSHLDDLDSPVVLTTMTPITVDQVSIEEELRARKQLLSRLSDAVPVGLFQIATDRQITFTNERLHAIVGAAPAATVQAQFSTVLAEDWPLLDGAVEDVLQDRAVDDLEVRLAAERVCVFSMRALTDSDGQVSGAIGCVSDVTDRVQLRRELETRATIDELTSCFNRTATLELLDDTLARPENIDPGAAVVFIDLNGFKQINDRFGHAVGDQVLELAAHVLRTAVRDCDRVGRVGGDEFLVICPAVESPSAALEIGSRLAEALAIDVDLHDGIAQLRASVGVAWSPEPLTSDVLVARADQAMYRSKRSGQPTATLFAPTDQAEHTTKAS